MSDARVRRERVLLFVVVLVAAGVVVASSGRTWATGEVTNLSGTVPVTVNGKTAAPAAVALGLAGLAAAVVLATAGRVVRALVGALLVAAGVVIALIAVRVPVDATDALEPSVRTATGTTTDEVFHVSASAWPVVVVAAGVVLALAGVFVLLRGHRWPGPSSRYERAGESTSEAAVAARRRGVSEPDDWEALSRGEDPTLDAATPDPGTGRDLPD